MNLLNMIKLANMIPPGVIKDNASWTSYVLDRQNFDNCQGVLIIMMLGATDKAVAALKVQQAEAISDDHTLTSASDVHDFTTKPAADDDNKLFAVYVSMGAWTKRYLNLLATAGNGTNGTYMAALAIGDRPGQSDVTAASLGLANDPEVVLTPAA